MTKHVRAIAIAAIFLVGCAVGGASARFVVPPANAQQQATLTKWEYFCVTVWGAKDTMELANRSGADGWEVAGTSQGSGGAVWCFKRPVVR